MAVSTTPPHLSVTELRGRFHGDLIGPDDASYDQARAVMYGGIDRRPALIVKAADVDDVAGTIALARESGLELAVRCGGHSAAGHSAIEGGILLDLSPMKRIAVDVESKSVWAEAGLTALELTTETIKHGLVVGFGDTGSVGIGGITLGGGVGYLGRKHGLTIDSLLGAELVTADGQRLRVDATSHPDLFWAIRGGGGNFGVVTSFRYRLHEIGTVVGGMLMQPTTPDSIAGFMAAAEAAPEELSGIANVMPAPPMPFVPEEHHGKLVNMAFLVWSGELQAAEKTLAPFRALAPAIVDDLKPISYPEIYPPEDPDYHPMAAAYTMFIDHVDLDVARTILDRLEGSDASLRVAQLRVLGGAMARVPADATAFAHRSQKIMVNLAAFYDGTEEDRIRRQSWVDDFAATLNQGSDAAYVNFLMDEGPARVRDAYPGKTWDRLVEVKRRYDPANFFHMNQNIPPGAS